jgi:DnaA-homolog protein
MGQIPLALRLERHAALDSFVAGANAAALEHVRAVASGARSDAVWLTGPAATGKTHLLAGACRAATAAGLRSMYVALDPALDPAMLRDLDAIDVLALDDVQLAAGRAEWERALFVTLDARLHHGGVLLAADRAPRDCDFRLPDLGSRAAAAAVYRLVALRDEDLAIALVRRAAQMGLSIDEPATSFLLQRVTRDLAELTDWLDRIDQAALAQQRRITIPLLREVLASAARERG